MSRYVNDEGEPLMSGEQARLEDELDELRRYEPDDDYYPGDDDGPLVCPGCGAEDPEVDELQTAGFTGAPCYVTTYKCCGHQDYDNSLDTLDWVR